MADNITIDTITGSPVASTDEVTTINGTGSLPLQHVQRMQLATVSGIAATDISTASPLPVSDAGGSLTVDGNVGVSSVPADPFGVNADAAVAAGSAGSIQGKLRQISADIAAVKTSVANIPTSPSTNAADAALGATADASVAAGAAGSLSAKLRRVTQGLEELKTLIVLGAGSAEIGGVNQTKVAGTAVDVGSGNKSAGTQRVVLATDQPALTAALLTTPGGNVTHGSADSGSPLKIGARVRTALIAALSQDNRSDLMTDKFGRLLSTLAPVDQVRSGTANYTTTSAADVIAAPGAAIAIVVTAVLVTNAHATVGTKVTIRDGTTAKIPGYAAAAGGGFIVQNSSGLFVATANTAVTAICATTGADVDVTVFGYLIPA